MQEFFVCKESEMSDGDVRIVKFGATDLGVYRYEGAYYAYRNQCVHQGGPACEGVTRFKVVDIIEPDQTFLGQTYDESECHIVCPWHGYEYDIKTGKCAADPSLRLKKYEVFAREGGLYVVI